MKHLPTLINALTEAGLLQHLTAVSADGTFSLHAESKDKEQEVQSVIDATDNPPAIAVAQATAQANVNLLAGALIQEVLPLWKQANAQARMLEILERQVSGATLTPQEVSDRASVMGLWAWIKAVRSAAAAANLAISKVTDEAEVVSLVRNIVWPSKP